MKMLECTMDVQIAVHCAVKNLIQCSAAKSSEYDGDTSLCVWSNRASAVIASSLLLQAMRAAFPNPGPGTSAKDITRERAMLALKEWTRQEYTVGCCLNIYLVEFRNNFKEQFNERRAGSSRQEIVLTPFWEYQPITILDPDSGYHQLLMSNRRLIRHNSTLNVCKVFFYALAQVYVENLSLEHKKFSSGPDICGEVLFLLPLKFHIAAVPWTPLGGWNSRQIWKIFKSFNVDAGLWFPRWLLAPSCSPKHRNWGPGFLPWGKRTLLPSPLLTY